MVYRVSFILGLCILFVVSCVPQTTDLEAPSRQETDNAVAPSGTPSPNAVTEGATSDEITTITFGAQSDYQAEITPYIKRFNDMNPDIKVEFVSLDDVKELSPPQEIAQATAQQVDTAKPVWIGAWTTQHPYFYDLGPLMEADATFDMDDFYPGSLEAATIDGKVYLLPQTRFVPLLSYNKELFAAQGIPEPSPDWTWQDLRATAEQLAQREGDTVTTYGLLDDGRGTVALLGELLAADPTLETTAREQARIEVEVATTALEQVVALAESGAVYIEQGEVADGAIYQEMILAEQFGMWPTGLVTDPFNQPTFEVGTIPFPETPISLHTHVMGYVMSAGTQHPEAAWRWLSFLNQQPLLFSSISSLTYEVPARLSVMEQPETWASFNATTNEALEASMTRPFTPDTSATWITQWLYSQLPTILRGEQTVTEAAQTAQTNLEAFKLAEQTQPDVDVDTIVVEAPVADTAPADATTITFASSVANLQPLVDQFHREQAEVFVQLEAVTNPTLTDLANTTDCFVTWAPPTLAQQAALLDLRPLWDADTMLSHDVFPSTVLAPFEQDGALYGLPHRVDIPTLHYNPVLFDDANLPYPTPDWSLEDFVAAATQLTQERDDQYGFAVLDGHTTTLKWWLQREGVLQNANALTWTDPDVIAALQGYVDLLTSTSPHDQLAGYTLSRIPDLTTQLVTGEQVAMWLDSRMTFSGTRYVQNGGTIRAPLPGGTIDNRANDVSVTTGLYIATDTPHANACWQWLRYVSDDVTGIIGGMPAHTDEAIIEQFAQEAEPGQSEVYAVYREALAQTTQAESQTFFLHDPDLDPFWFYQALDRALQGANLEQELTTAQQLTEAYLACMDAGGVGGDCAVETDPDYDGWQQRIETEE